MSHKPLSNEAKAIVKLCEQSIDDPISVLRDKLDAIQRILKDPESLDLRGQELRELKSFSEYKDDDPDFVLGNKLYIIKHIFTEGLDSITRDEWGEVYYDVDPDYECYPRKD